jgi:hypothetical protein
MICSERHSVRFAEAWFDEPITPPEPDIVALRHSRQRPTDGDYTVKLSLVTDLTVSSEAIFSSFRGECRRQIRKGEAAGFRVESVHRPRNQVEVQEFVHFYNRFASAKGIAHVDPSYLERIASSGRLWLSSVASGDEILARHSCIATDATVRSLFAGAIFRSADPSRQRAISFAHRQLHWMDLVGYKAAGFKLYDWGGIFPDEGQPGAKGVNDFKREFGGKPVEYFESERALTFRGQMYLRSRPAFRAARTAVTKIFGETPSRPSPQKPGAIPEKLALPRPG